MKNTLIKLIDFIIYGHVLMALCAAFSTFSTIKMINNVGNNNAIRLALFVGAATFFLYNLHKPITYFLRKQFVHNQRFRRTKDFQIPLSILTVLSAFYCLFFFLKLTLNAQLLLIGMSFLSLGYVLPILNKKRRLRDVAYLKIFLIAFVWAVITVLLPIINSINSTNNHCIWQLFLERCCFIFALCIPFDIRDMTWDLKTNVKTIPLSIGVKNAKICAILTLTIAILMVLMLYKATIYTQLISLELIIMYLATALIIVKTKDNRSDYFFYGLIDGMILMHSLIIILN
jgi:4-hydroxybenzoate polyprenyltransferase